MQATRRTPIARPVATGLVLAVAAILVTVDQVTKHFALSLLEPGVPRPFVGELLKLRLVFNPGAAFSLGAESTWIFAILASVVSAFLLFYLAPRVRHLGWATGFGLLTAGVVGNLIDRIFRDPAPFRGHVIDFLELPNWPIFNVADMCIIAAAVVIVVLSLLTRTQWNVAGSGRRAATSDAETPSAETEPGADESGNAESGIDESETDESETFGKASESDPDPDDVDARTAEPEPVGDEKPSE